jgi:putative CRISPR-associated protein (TIGR02619 family)
MNHHILTTGVSLLQNFANSQKIEIAEAIQRHSQVKEYLFENPRKASAEINSLDARVGLLNSRKANLDVTLIRTETDAGKCVASLLEKFLKSKRINVHRIPVKGFDKPAGDFTAEFAQREATEALTQMRESVIRHIGKLQQNPRPEIELNCTGGYKAEVAVLYELGRTLRLPVYYLHESFKVCITLP